VGAVGVVDHQLAAVVLLGAAQEEGRRQIGAHAEGAARQLPDGIVHVRSERHAGLVAVEQRWEDPQRQGGGHEERGALERGHDDLAQLARLRGALRHLEVVLGPGREVAGGGAAVHPLGVLQQGAAARHLRLGQDPRDVQEHRAV
jgi:hypothetical protein